MGFQGLIGFGGGATGLGQGSAGDSPIVATGGVISDYTDPTNGNVYRTHVFLGDSTFVVSDLSLIHI